MLGTAAMLASCRVYSDRSRDSIILSAAFVCFSFYAVCTEMTERYVLATLPLLLLIAPSDRKFARIYGVLAITVFINLYFVFPLLGIYPWDALKLPHSNYFYYRQSDTALPVLSLASPTNYLYISIGISLVHVLMLVYLAITVCFWRRSIPNRQHTVPDT